MCNEYAFETRWEEYSRIMAREQLELPAGQGARDLLRKASIRVGEPGMVIRAAGNGVELAPMAFGFPAPKQGRPPVFNFRSEGRHFGDSRRCLIPASGFFEFTGTSYPKTRHRLWMRGEPCFAIAGLWRDSPGGDAFTMLTTAPGPDIEPIHDRQIVILPPGKWADWLYLTEPESKLLLPLPAGTLDAEVAPR